jgi:outer membrane protein TolC
MKWSLLLPAILLLGCLSALVGPLLDESQAGDGLGDTSLSLDQAIEITLRQNPSLVTQRQGEAVSQAAVGVASAYPYNPSLQTVVLPYSVNSLGNSVPVQNSVALLQTVELAHQQRHREDAATADFSRTTWSIRRAEALQAAQTERLYFTAIYQRDLRNMSMLLANVNDELIGVLERRLSAAQSTATDLALARIEARSARQQADLAAGSYQSALAELHTQLGLPQPCFLEPEGDLAARQWFPAPAANSTEPNPSGDWLSSVTKLVANRPDVMAARAELAAAQAALNLAHAAMVPNLVVGPNYERDNTGVLMIGVQAQMDLPIVNSGKPLMRQREAEVCQKQVALDQLFVQARLEAEAALARYDRARTLLERTRNDLSAPLVKDVRQIEDSFRAGQTDLIHVFTARATLIQAQRGLLDLVNEVAQAAAKVSETTGLPPQLLVQYACPGGAARAE